MGNKQVVLVVDDDPVNFDVIEILLFKEGYDLHYKDNGAEASLLLQKPTLTSFY